MADAEDLTRRVTALEAEVRDLADRVQRSEQDAAAARVLAGGADRDVGEIRAEIRDFRDQNNRVLNVMRTDLTDLASRVDDLSERTDRGFGEVRGALDAAATGQSHIVELLNQIIDRGS
jgi:outer membrane murein-binding lipoprotein Lpp